MTLEVGFSSHPGRKRQTNQDAVGVFLAANQDSSPSILIVADGMGGHRGGDMASRLAVETIQKVCSQAGQAQDYRALLSEGVQAAHREICLAAGRDAQLSDMGTTVVIAIVTRGRAFLANVGDSRAYRARGGTLSLLSRDHSWVAEQVRAGLISEEEARNHPHRSRLTMALSPGRAQVTPYLAETTLEAGDNLVLCTDGLWGVISETILAAVVDELSPQAAADKLVSLANQNLGPDNISVVVARYSST
ncbi:MAG: PP2C family protein-serine/threonine phosphatase [Chloroflexota bacterium]